METKKCPKCGAEIPVEMSFCLHCMERTDGVLEIRKKSVPSRKYIIAVIIAFAIMTAVIVLLILSLNGKNDHDSSDNSVNLTATQTTADGAVISSESANVATEQITTTPKTETATTSTMTAVNQNDTVQKPETIEETNETEESSESEQPEDQTSVPQETHANNPPPEQTPTENTATVNFEEVFTQRLNSWGASHVLTDTLSFSENGCTFTSNVGTDKVNCTVSASYDMTDFTLTIEPATEYTRYSTSVYIPDIVNEITYFVLDYRMSSSMRTDIGLMFENFEAEVSFAENELNCNISTQSHNNGSYPITVNCTLD